MKKPSSSLITIILLLSLLMLFPGCIVPTHRFTYHEFHSDAMKENMDYGIYLPPDWDGKTPLPLMVFLHGAGDDETCFDHHRATDILDDSIRSGKLDPFILITPNGDLGFWRNFYDGSRLFEDYVVKDLIPRILARYPILPGRENCHIMGMSMGGFGAMSVASHHLDTFASASSLSGLLFDTDESIAFVQKYRRTGIEQIFGPADNREVITSDNIYTRFQSPGDLRGLKLLVGAGNTDRADSMRTAASFHDHLAGRNVPHVYLVYRGGHKWRYWEPVIPIVIAIQVFGKNPAEFQSDPVFESLVF